jgi:FkbM family methyltransferase
LYFKTLYPKSEITAFEADEKMAKILTSNLKKNNINDIKVISSAVWIDNNGIEFSTEGADGGSIQGMGAKQKVTSVRLREVLQSFYKVDLLKIDIEGAEYEVIKDCQNYLDNVENLFIEYHSWNNTPQKLSEILDILEKNNFRYYMDGVCNRRQPFVFRAENIDMDLQLNIYGVRRKNEYLNS